MNVFLWIVRLFVFGLLLIFSINNTDLVQLNPVFASNWDVPLILIILGAFGLGVVSGALLQVSSLFRYRREVYQLKRELKDANEKLEEHQPADFIQQGNGFAASVPESPRSIF